MATLQWGDVRRRDSQVAASRSDDAPEITVITAAYNAMPFITECIESVLNQTLRSGRIEFVVIDDGSTDGTGAEIDRLAVETGRLRVVHQANSGAPARARNVGLDLARGRYVMFVDADDYLAAGALAAMLAVADANGSDVVLGKMVGAGGRRVNQSMFHRTQPVADLFDSRVYWTLNPLKLFRRRMLEDHRIRFVEGQGACDDQPFTSAAYLAAKVISVAADQVCYYQRSRGDGGNLTQRDRDAVRRLATQRAVMAHIAVRVPPGPRRDFLMRRHFQIDVGKCFRAMFEAAGEPTRTAIIAAGTEIVDAWYTPAIAAALPAITRLGYHCLAHRMPAELAAFVHAATTPSRIGAVVADSRVYATYPYLDDARVGIPRAAYDVTGEVKAVARLAGVRWHGGHLRVTGSGDLPMLATDGTKVTLVLRERTSGAERHVPAETRPTATGEIGFTADVDPRRLDPTHPDPTYPDRPEAGALRPDGEAGRWDAYLEVEVSGVSRRTRLGRGHAATGDAFDLGSGYAGRLVRPYLTKSRGNLTLETVGTQKLDAPVVDVGVFAASAAMITAESPTSTSRRPGGVADQDAAAGI